MFCSCWSNSASRPSECWKQLAIYFHDATPGIANTSFYTPSFPFWFSGLTSSPFTVYTQYTLVKSLWHSQISAHRTIPLPYMTSPVYPSIQRTGRFLAFPPQAIFGAISQDFHHFFAPLWNHHGSWQTCQTWIYSAKNTIFSPGVIPDFGKEHIGRVSIFRVSPNNIETSHLR